MVRDGKRTGTVEPTLELLALADDELQRRLQLVGPDDWTRPTPCAEWDVRALVNHVVGANVRYEMLLRGASAAEVEATRGRDHLGVDAAAAFAATGAAMRAAFAEPGALGRVVRHAVGDRTGRELLAMRIVDIAVHAWDLAQALGADDEIDVELVAFALAQAPAMAAAPGQRSFASPIAGDGDRSPQEQLLRLLGRQPHSRGANVTVLDDFLAELMPRIHEAEVAIHAGDAGPRFAMWSHTDPVTVLGARWNAIGWREVEPMFERLAAGFSGCTSCDWEVVAAEVGADMAYIAAIERTTAAMGNQPPTSYALRSTTILRREGNEWKIVHRHGSPYDDRAAPLLAHLDVASGDAPDSSNT